MYAAMGLLRGVALSYSPNFFFVISCRAYISSRSRAASIKSRSLAAFCIFFFVSSMLLFSWSLLMYCTTGSAARLSLLVSGSMYALVLLFTLSIEPCSIICSLVLLTFVCWYLYFKKQISFFPIAVLIFIGIVSASFGFKGFLLTNHFIDGGATGISLLLSAITKWPLYIWIIAVNIPFIILAYVVMGRFFAMKTAVAITGLAICLAMVTFPNVTNDNLLVAIFGGFFLGAGIGLAVRGGAVIDGTEVLAIYLSRKFGTTLGDIIIAINIIIFSAAAYLLGIEVALYSMITYLAASKTLDFNVEGIEEYIGATIVSVHSEKIREMVLQKMGRGVPV